jgi:hypothetical protein
MGRVLIIAIACVIGALGTWLFVPTIQRVPVNPDMPVFNYDPDATPKADTTAPKAGVITEEKRRARAEQLIGKKLKYIVSDQLHTSAWFTEQGVQVIERALDECYLVTTYDLYAQHIEAISEADSGDDENADPLASFQKAQPSLTQAKNCLNVARAYKALHGLKVDF